MRNPAVSRWRRTMENPRQGSWKIGSFMQLLLGVTLLVITIVPLLAQTTTGTISGTVVDPGRSAHSGSDGLGYE